VQTLKTFTGRSRQVQEDMTKENVFSNFAMIENFPMRRLTSTDALNTILLDLTHEI